MFKLIIALIIVCSVSVAQAETVTKRGIACLSKDSLLQVIRANNENDAQAIKYLFKYNCFVTKPGHSLSILDRTWSGLVKARVYGGSGAFVIWTLNNNIQRY